MPSCGLPSPPAPRPGRQVLATEPDPVAPPPPTSVLYLIRILRDPFFVILCAQMCTKRSSEIRSPDGLPIAPGAGVADQRSHRWQSVGSIERAQARRARAIEQALASGLSPREQIVRGLNVSRIPIWLDQKNGENIRCIAQQREGRTIQRVPNPG